jgi:alpha-1,6-mannosyltransferase
MSRQVTYWSLGALVGVLLIAWAGLTDFAFNDYGNEAAAAVQALITGDPGRFLELAPAYGGSLVLRAPFALSVVPFGGGELAAYRMLALPCLLSGAALGAWLVARQISAGVGPVARAAVLVLAVANPLTLKMLEIGHPEEMLTGVLCVAAIVAAGSRRPTLAGILLGLAVGSKAWALVAVGPVILAAPSARLRVALAALVAATVLTAPVMLADLAAPGGTSPLAAAAAHTGSGFQPWQAFWFLGEHDGVVRSIYGVKPGYRTPPDWLSPIAHPGIVLVAAGLSLLFAARRRSRATWHDALLLLALVLLARCVLDPWNNIYYSIPFLLTLTTWETLTSRRPPVLSLAVGAATWLTFDTAPAWLSPDAQAALYAAWSLPLLVVLACRVLAVGVPRTWPRVRRPERLPDTA